LPVDVAQVVELGAAHEAAATTRHVAEHRAVQREDALDPTPLLILRTVNVALTPLPRRAMTTPSNACRRSFSPSFTRTLTRTVSPARNGGTLRSHSFWVSMNGCI
jgi:hypothetical protein